MLNGLQHKLLHYYTIFMQKSWRRITVELMVTDTEQEQKWCPTNQTIAMCDCNEKTGLRVEPLHVMLQPVKGVKSHFQEIIKQCNILRVSIELT